MRLQDAIPDRVKVLLKQIAYGLYRLSEHFFRGPFNKYDFQAITVFRKYLKRDSNCIDIGANVGHILREIIKAAPDGQHIAFEPLPALFNHLQKKYGNEVRLFNCALANREGQAEFYYYKDSPALSGLKERKNLGEHRIVKLKVETRTLDDVISSNRPVDLIKIDVEGAELSVLQGAIETLKRNRPMVLFEAGLGGADEYDATPEQFFDLFSGCSLSLSLMEYFLQGKKPLSKDEFCGHFYKHYNYFYIAYDVTKV
ncbi:MAG: FkbM family methyltransferase [Nitrososphaera sp.]|nr:FkbM family methyltransferase [Nitrososphaera sp.]